MGITCRCAHHAIVNEQEGTTEGADGGGIVRCDQGEITATSRFDPPRLLGRSGSFDPLAPRQRTRVCAGYELEVPAGTNLTLARPLLPWLARHLTVGVSASRHAISLQAIRWRLSPRQSEVLGCLVTGLSNRAIALQLGCALGTVEQHVSVVLERSGLGSRAEVLRACLG